MVFESACMRGRVGRALLAIALASPLAIAAGACGTSSTAAAPSAQLEAAVCPATPEDTIGKACPVEGTTCGPQYACGTTFSALYCVCSGGTFGCRDGTGKALNPGDTPACPSAPPALPACPASFRAANLHACTAPGQICAYPSACRGAYDQCYCFPGETAGGGFGTVFACQPATCATDAAAPPVEAGRMNDAASGPDAPVDANAPQEAAVVDDAAPEAASDAGSGQD